MKKYLYKIEQHRHFLLFILLFAYVQSIYTRIAVAKQINSYTFTPEAALTTTMGASVLFLVILFFLNQWQKNNRTDTKTLLKVFGTSLLVFVVIMQLLGFLIALSFGTIERNFNSHSFIVSVFSHVLDGSIYGSFFIAYFYYQHHKNHQQTLATYHRALAESKISQLKTQLNPHFLFNNLNVLDQLIDEDQDKASDFLNEFAEIYRYVLDATERDMVAITDEINFAKRYFKLIQHKYAKAYQLEILTVNPTGFVVPLTLQLLIENAIQHNLGTQDYPIHIRITIDKQLEVVNNVCLKHVGKSKSGRALNNLKEQYRLLSEKSLEIECDSQWFSVTIPIIYHPQT